MKHQGEEEEGDFDCRHLAEKKKKEKLSRKILTYDLRATTPLFRPLLVIYEEGLTQTLWFVFINS